MWGFENLQGGHQTPFHLNYQELYKMANFKIISGVVVGDTTYAPGMEKELAEKADAKQIAYLTEQGALEAVGKSVVATEAAAAEKAAAPNAPRTKK